MQKSWSMGNTQCNMLEITLVEVRAQELVVVSMLYERCITSSRLWDHDDKGMVEIKFDSIHAWILCRQVFVLWFVRQIHAWSGQASVSRGKASHDVGSEESTWQPSNIGGCTFLTFSCLIKRWKKYHRWCCKWGKCVVCRCITLIWMILDIILYYIMILDNIIL